MCATHWGYDTRATLVFRFLEGFDASTFFHSSTEQLSTHLIQVIPVKISRSEVVLNLRQAFFEERNAPSTFKEPHQGERIAKLTGFPQACGFLISFVLTGSAFLETMEEGERDPRSGTKTVWTAPWLALQAGSRGLVNRL
jgi:hypothetical protein